MLEHFCCLRAGRIGTIFAELNWAGASDTSCPASDMIAILDEAGYRFAAPGPQMVWRGAGNWLKSLSDIVARKE
jgi:hypothetical protein